MDLDVKHDDEKKNNPYLLDVDVPEVAIWKLLRQESQGDDSDTLKEAIGLTYRQIPVPRPNDLAQELRAVRGLVDALDGPVAVYLTKYADGRPPEDWLKAILQFVRLVMVTGLCWEEVHAAAYAVTRHEQRMAMSPFLDGLLELGRHLRFHTAIVDRQHLSHPLILDAVLKSGRLLPMVHRRLELIIDTESPWTEMTDLCMDPDFHLGWISEEAWILWLTHCPPQHLEAMLEALLLRSDHVEQKGLLGTRIEATASVVSPSKSSATHVDVLHYINRAVSPNFRVYHRNVTTVTRFAGVTRSQSGARRAYQQFDRMWLEALGLPPGFAIRARPHLRQPKKLFGVSVDLFTKPEVIPDEEEEEDLLM